MITNTAKQLRAKQSARWVRVSRTLPALKVNCKALCAEFADTPDLNRREEILKECERAAQRIEAYHRSGPHTPIEDVQHAIKSIQEMRKERGE